MFALYMRFICAYMIEMLKWVMLENQAINHLIDCDDPNAINKLHDRLF